jgi:hypothetical protein
VTKGFGPKYIQTQIIASNDAGGTGWLLWSPGNHYTDSYAAMQNIPKGKSGNKHTEPGAPAKENKQTLPEKNAVPSGQPVGANQQPSMGTKPGFKS